MPNFSKSSLAHLETCVPEIRGVLNVVVKKFDCRVTCGRRGEEAQNAAYHTGASKKKWPESVHNAEAPKLSKAVDVIPYPVNWKDWKRFHYFAGWVMATARSMGYVFRWGGDWDRDTDLRDQTFFDLPHFEYVGLVSELEGGAK